MNLPNSNLRTYVDSIAQRVVRLEREVGAMRRERVQDVMSCAAEEQAVVAPPGAEQVAEVVEVPVAMAQARQVSIERPIVESVVIEADVRPERPEERSFGALESVVGGRWYAVVGAAIVVVGVAIFLTVAVQRGWLVLSPSFRCMGAGVFGLGLLVTGERLRTRVNSAASTGLLAAGIGVLYAACHVAYSMYGLVGAGAAATLLSVVTLVGICVATRASSALLGALTVGVAFGTPLVTFGDVGVVSGVPLYVCTLLTLAQVLGVRSPSVFSWAMRVGWAGTIIVGGIWIARFGAANPIASLVFSGAVWLLLQAGFGLRARNAQRGEELAEETSLLDIRLWGDATASFAGTTWATVGAWYVARASGVVHESLPMFGAAAGSWLLAIVLVGHARLTDISAERVAERLGMSLLAQGAAAVVAGLALALPTSLVSVAWLALGCGAVLCADRLWSQGLLVYGVCVTVLASTRLVTLDAFNPGLRAGVVLGGLHVSWWNAAAACAGLCWLAVARVGAGRGRSWLGASYVFAAVGGVYLLLACCHPQSEMMSMAVAATVVATAVGLAGRVLRGLRTEWIGLSLLIVSVLLWTAGLHLWGGQALDAPGVNVSLVVGMLISAAAMVLRSRIDLEFEVGRASAAVGAVLMLLCATSLEVAHLAGSLFHEPTVRRAAVSVWWGVFAVGLILPGFAAARRGEDGGRELRAGGLALLGAAAVKAVLFDLGSASALARAASLVGVGLLMLLVAGVYAAARKRMAGAAR